MPVQSLIIALVFTLTLTMVSTMTNAQPRGFNYDEAKVPKYTLPDPLTLEDGKKVTDAETWRKQRRPEILKMFTEQMFGPIPKALNMTHFSVFEKSDNALDGKAIRKQVRVMFTKDPKGPRMEMLMYLPKQAKGAVPLIVGLNFGGNHTVHKDPAIVLPSSPMRNKKPANESDRGRSASRWPVEHILSRGYGVATIYYGDIDPDYHDGWKNGIHPLFPELQNRGDNMTSIAAWSYGLSRAMDYFEIDDDVDHKHVGVLGHSRLGKTSLWAGANDERFAMVISNDSGCGGAALSKRAFGETVKRINTSFPHWFTANFKQYNDKEESLPFDQHMLIALIAPRPVVVCSAVDDKWADPKGEFLSALHADPVYKLLGTEGIKIKQWPKPNKLDVGTITYHIRPGKHDVTMIDWNVYLDVADYHWKKK